MKNWKTTLAGIAGVAVYAVGVFFPEYRDLAAAIAAALFGGGLIAAKDHNVTGT